MQEMTAYLDNAATTRVCDEALAAAVAMMRDCYGNPSSLHALGADSAKQMARAREAVASLLGCQPECVYFTSGGSEANNLAIFGAAGARARLGKRIVTTATEHSSVSGAVGRLEGEGWDVVRVRPDAHGQIDARAVADAVDGQTALVSMMYVNNETGAVFPVERAARLIRAKNPRTLIHCDGVQAFGKLPVHVGRTEIDLMSVSGHKICAPKGSGALYIRRRVKEHFERAGALRGRLLELLAQIEGVRVLSPPDGSPYITCLSVPGYRSETMLHFLESRGVFVSSGSACSKGASSPVLAAMGLPAPVIDGALRVSLIYTSREEELRQLADALAEGIRTVAHR